MKYELEPDNRNCSDDVLINDLREVAGRLGKPTLTRDKYEQHGRFSSATITKRIGWNRALEKAGLSVQKRINIPPEEMLADLKRVAALLGTKTVTAPGYKAHGRFAQHTMVRVFKTWANALSAAGLQPTGWKPKATEDELFQNMASVWLHVGRQPRQSDFHPPISNFSDKAYARHFGSWRKALEAFVASANKVEEAKDAPEDSDSSSLPMVNAPKGACPSTPRMPSWRLKFLTMRRDNFRCRFCGRVQSPPDVTLHIDHIHPWSKGGETVLGNLQTLCNQCNIGKSNLDMSE